MNTNELINLGAKEWKSGSKHRFYFNNIASRYGLKVTRYNSGSVKSATLNGDDISNSFANELLRAMPDSVWYDVTDGKFHYYADGSKCTEIAEKVIATINSSVTL